MVKCYTVLSYYNFGLKSRMCIGLNDGKNRDDAVLVFSFMLLTFAVVFVNY